jgi:hypothetical protein
MVQGIPEFLGMPFCHFWSSLIAWLFLHAAHSRRAPSNRLRETPQFKQVSGRARLQSCRKSLKVCRALAPEVSFLRPSRLFPQPANRLSLPKTGLIN